MYYDEEYEDDYDENQDILDDGLELEVIIYGIPDLHPRTINRKPWCGTEIATGEAAVKLSRISRDWERSNYQDLIFESDERFEEFMELGSAMWDLSKDWCYDLYRRGVSASNAAPIIYRALKLYHRSK